MKLLFIVLYLISVIYMMNSNKNKKIFIAFCIVILSITIFIHFCNPGNILFYLFPISYVPYALGKNINSLYGRITLITLLLNYAVLFIQSPSYGIDLSPHILFIIMMMFSMDYFAEQSRKQYEMNIKNEKLALLSTQIERNRISQDLHDSLGQVFSTLAVKSELALKLIEKYPDMAKDELQEIHSLSQESLYKVRSIIEDIKSTTIEDEVVQVEKILRDANIEFERKVHYESVDEIQQHEVSMLIKELINNVIKHSEATKVQLLIDQVDNILNLSLSDNGKGLSNSMSLKSIEARAQAMDGIVKTKSLNPGLGVYVTVEVKS
ncbi:sensor histidine kinase [Macrococcoides bohemicum]|uniref:sensor histidine kinase n=1 Tax=Macrococcoides bohemicum TaxID=1903056 RepID=UPI0012FDE31C|nr:MULTISPECIES: sensor histidine kinase [Macrococcus]MBC9874536.1 sensor histidine kinase [Macrococcus bohemicus]